MKYTCLVCGRSFPYLAAWYQHLIRCHPDLEPEWARAMRLGLGRRPPLWEVLKDVRGEGLVVIVRERGGKRMGEEVKRETYELLRMGSPLAWEVLERGGCGGSAPKKRRVETRGTQN